MDRHIAAVEVGVRDGVVQGVVHPGGAGDLAEVLGLLVVPEGLLLRQQQLLLRIVVWVVIGLVGCLAEALWKILQHYLID